MYDYKFDTVADLQAVVDQFCNCPKGSRLTVAKRVINRLSELGGYVRVYNDNPITLYKSDRFIVLANESRYNEFSKYFDIIKKDKRGFNSAVFEDMKVELVRCKSIPNVLCRGNQLNYDANVVYRQFFPEDTDYMYILEQSCSKLFNFYANGTDVNVCEEALDEIYYLMNGLYLTDTHIKRQLLPVSIIKDWSLYKALDDVNIGDRIDTLMSMTKEDKRTPFDFLAHSNKIDQVEFYMKMQKRSHEQTFVNSNLYSSGNNYRIDNKINVNGMRDIYEVIKMDDSITTLLTSDVFRLRENGFSIEEYGGSGVRLSCFRDDGIDYLVGKSKSIPDDYIAFYRNRMGAIKRFKIVLKPKREPMSSEAMDRFLESMLVKPNTKMNRI